MRDNIPPIINAGVTFAGTIMAALMTVYLGNSHEKKVRDRHPGKELKTAQALYQSAKQNPENLVAVSLYKTYERRMLRKQGAYLTQEYYQDGIVALPLVALISFCFAIFVPYLLVLSKQPTFGNKSVDLVAALIFFVLFFSLSIGSLIIWIDKVANCKSSKKRDCETFAKLDSIEQKILDSSSFELWELISEANEVLKSAENPFFGTSLDRAKTIAELLEIYSHSLSYFAAFRPDLPLSISKAVDLERRFSYLISMEHEGVS